MFSMNSATTMNSATARQILLAEARRLGVRVVWDETAAFRDASSYTSRAFEGRLALRPRRAVDGGLELADVLREAHELAHAAHGSMASDDAAEGDNAAFCATERRLALRIGGLAALRSVVADQLSNSEEMGTGRLSDAHERRLARIDAALAARGAS